MRSTETIERYDPRADLAENHPDWTVEITALHGLGEIIDVPAKLILIDPGADGEAYALAHACVHLDLGHVTADGGGDFTDEQEADADDIARLRLDQPDVIPPPRRSWQPVRILLGAAMMCLTLLLVPGLTHDSPASAWADAPIEAAAPYAAASTAQPRPAAPSSHGMIRHATSHVTATHHLAAAKPSKAKPAQPKRTASASIPKVIKSTRAATRTTVRATTQRAKVTVAPRAKVTVAPKDTNVTVGRQSRIHAEVKAPSKNKPVPSVSVKVGPVGVRLP